MPVSVVHEYIRTLHEQGAPLCERRKTYETAKTYRDGFFQRQESLP